MRRTPWDSDSVYKCEDDDHAVYTIIHDTHSAHFLTLSAAYSSSS
jgi:hypothetical protein